MTRGPQAAIWVHRDTSVAPRCMTLPTRRTAMKPRTLICAAEVKGYHVHATDGDIGHIENLMIDVPTWGVRYLVIDTSNWWMGKHVLVSPYAATRIVWTDRKVDLDVSRDRVKNSPPWDPLALIDHNYQRRLHGYYGWPGYGW
jgi:hypothetical protein